MDISETEIRLRCVEAAADAPLSNPHNVLKLAEAFVAFVQGGSFPGHVSNADIQAQLSQLETQGNNIMTTVSDLKAQQVALLAEVTANTDAINSVSTFVTGLKGQISDLQAQLAAAGTDPAALADVAAGLDQVKAGLDAQGVALAAVSNTPAAP